MRIQRVNLIIACLAGGLSLLGCNLPSGSPTPDLSGTIIASTLGVLQTNSALTLTAEGPSATATPVAVGTPPPVASETHTPRPAQNPVVTKDSLCWVGPGSQFEVVSAIPAGTPVELLGRGTLPGWYIVRNPIYRDPCWIPAANLSVPPGTDLASLPYFSPPDTPTFTPTKTPLNTPTASSTP
jgi:hypothetical protein